MWPSCFSCVQLFGTHQAPLSMGFSRQEYYSGYHFLLQGIFPIQELTSGLPHCKQILYCLSHQGTKSLLTSIGHLEKSHRSSAVWGDNRWGFLWLICANSTREGLFPKLDGSCVPTSIPASLRQGSYLFISVFFEPSNDSPKGVLDGCRMSENQTFINNWWLHDIWQ